MKIVKLVVGLTLGVLSISAYSADQVTEYAKKSGYKACLSTVSHLEKFFGENTNYGSWAFVAAENSDDQLLSATLELTYNDGATLVDFTVFPAKDGTCSYSYTRTFYSEKNCIATSKEDFMKNTTYKTEINKNIAAFEDQNGAKLLLTSAGNGCLVQKKEIGFRHKKQNSE